MSFSTNNNTDFPYAAEEVAYANEINYRQEMDQFRSYEEWMAYQEELEAIKPTSTEGYADELPF